MIANHGITPSSCLEQPFQFYSIGWLLPSCCPYIFRKDMSHTEHPCCPATWNHLHLLSIFPGRILTAARIALAWCLHLIHQGIPFCFPSHLGQVHQSSPDPITSIMSLLTSLAWRALLFQNLAPAEFSVTLLVILYNKMVQESRATMWRNWERRCVLCVRTTKMLSELKGKQNHF